LPEDGPLAGLAAELYQLLYADVGDGLEVTVTKTRDGVRSNRLLRRCGAVGPAKAIAEKHLADSAEGLRISLRMDRASVVISSSTSSIGAPPAARKEPERSYIPLEPEAPPEDKAIDGQAPTCFAKSPAPEA
jgi:hypothetical protein